MSDRMAYSSHPITFLKRHSKCHVFENNSNLTLVPNAQTLLKVTFRHYKYKRRMKKMSEVKEAFNKISAGSAINFDIDVDVTINKKQWQGNFVVKNPTVKDEIMISVEKAKLRDGVSEELFGREGNWYVEALATMKVLTLSYPTWVDRADTLPTEVIIAFYQKYLEQLTFFRSPVDEATA